jgi:hypothetical protein
LSSLDALLLELDMKIEIYDRANRMTESNREHGERSLHFALDRFREGIASVEVSIEDMNGPKGGADLRCFGRMKVKRSGTLEITQISTSVGDGLSKLARRFGRVVARRLEARKKFTRQTIRNMEV